MVETKNAKPVPMGFFDLFITPKTRPDDLVQRHDRIGRDNQGRLALVRTRKKAPKKPNASPPGSTKAEPPASPKVEEPPPPEVTVTIWTNVEDAALLGLKAQRKSWKEISETIAGKDLEAIKARYRLLYDLAPAEVKVDDVGAKGKSKEGEAKEGDGGNKAKGGEEKGNDGAKKGKGRSNEEPKKGWKTPKATTVWDEGNTDDDLSSEDIIRLQEMKDRYDEKKWVELSSRFFDLYGKRVDPDRLKVKLS